MRLFIPYVKTKAASYYKFREAHDPVLVIQVVTSIGRPFGPFSLRLHLGAEGPVSPGAAADLFALH